MLLDRLGAIAQRLQPSRWLLWSLFTASVLAFIVAVINPALAGWAQPAFISGIWSILALSFVLGFQHVPPKLDAGLWRRLLRSMHRGLYLLLAVLILGATIGLVLLTLRLLLYAS